MIEVHDLTKRFGDIIAVDHINFQVRPGVITGFLGPNGAGKSTTMRMILGLDQPTSGYATVNGHGYKSARAPMAELGALLEAKATDKGRSARNHLLALGATVGIGASRVDELLEVVGLTDVANKAAGQFSLGMSQRLGIASALLADPSIVMLDEPVNGLDPDGILWIRNLLKDLAGEGRTVFLSSHLMSEMEVTAEHLIVIGRGKLIADISMQDFIAGASKGRVRVSSPDAAQLRQALSRPEVSITSSETLSFEVEGVSSAEIGEVARAHGLVLHELVNLTPSLEEAFMELTKDSLDFHGASSTHPATAQLRKAS